MARFQQLNRSFPAAANSTSTGAFVGFSRCFTNLPTRSFLTKPTMNMVSNYLPGTRLGCSPFGGYDAKSAGAFLPFRIHTTRPQSSFSFQPQLGLGFSKCAIRPVNIINYGSRGGNKGSSLSYNVTFARRAFCQVPRAGETINNIAGVSVGTSGAKRSPFRSSDKHRRRNNSFSHPKYLEVEGKNVSKSSINTAKDVDMVTSTDPSFSEVKELNVDVSVETSISTSDMSNDKGKTKRGNNKGKRKPGKSPASNIPPLPRGSENTSQAKKSSVTEDLEIGLNGKASAALPESKKATTQQKSQKKARATKKSVKAVATTVEVKPQANRSAKQLYPPTGKSVVVVESVTKAKVIQGYLGEMFEVLPSYGHVRDLAARSGSVRPDEDFSMVWEVPSAAWTHLKSIKVALSETENLILASDPDREGEAIAWHIIEMLQQQNALRNDINIARVVFNEITESSIKKALQSPRDIDVNLVHAYLARRALDYLIGFNISPLLWRKLPGCQSAGRVQSAALSLICDRETEIDEFKPQEYWSVEVGFKKLGNNVLCPSHLTHFNSEKLTQFSVTSQTEANSIEHMLNSFNFLVVGSSKKKNRNNPSSPYITSSLQQDAANKLHFSASYTMKLAQKLYEGIKLSDERSAGLITYMRTDGLHMSDEAVKDIRSLIAERYGNSFMADSARKFFKKVKNAQEAHEAIRPTDIQRLPSMLVGLIDEDSLKLYTLIWSRTVACQMAPAVIQQIQVDIGNAESSIVFRSACSKMDFLGFQAVYGEEETASIRSDRDVVVQDEVFEVLSKLRPGDVMDLGNIQLKQHFTQPPPRYSEGSLVKKLEELGIGRPSTYASTIKVLKDRNYLTVKSRMMYPEFRGRMVSAFLSHHFTEVTDYSFTADMETELDNVSAGLTEWKGLLRDYWTRFSNNCDRTSNVHIHQIEKMLEKKFGGFLFSSLPNQSRTCPSCGEGTLIFKVSRFGSGYFIGCDQHPKCKYIAKTLYGDDDEDDTTPSSSKAVEPPKLLGLHPGSSEQVLLKKGPYGYYVQLGEDKKGYIPKRAAISHSRDITSVTLEDALQLLRFPVTLGTHPEDGQPVLVKLAKNGYAVKHRRTTAPVPKKTDPLKVTLEKALKLLTGKDAKRCGRPVKKKTKETVQAV